MRTLKFKFQALVMVLLFFYSVAQAQETQWKEVEKAVGKSGTVQDDIIKFTFPRYDLNVKVGNLTLDPGLGLTSWFVIMKMQDAYSAMGELVLPDLEIPAVEQRLAANGLQITAIHNHLIKEKPSIKYLHFSGTGNAVELAKRIRLAIDATATPIKPPPLKKTSQATDWSKVESIMGYSGKASGSILQFSIPRLDVISEKGMALPPISGMAVSINFQAAADKAAISGDFILLADEVNSVVKTLAENNIVITALHNHMLYETPRLFFLHFWALGNPEILAESMHNALDKINVLKGK